MDEIEIKELLKDRDKWNRYREENPEWVIRDIYTMGLFIFRKIKTVGIIWSPLTGQYS